MMPGCSRNWRRTSSTTAPPARPTASIDSEANRQTIRPPSSSPIRTGGSLIPKEIDVADLVLEFFLEAGEQHDRGEHGGADRVALGDGLRRVADGVQAVGHFAHVLGQLGHLGDATGVVGDRPEGVKRDDQPGQRQQPHDRHADAVDTGDAAAGELPRAEDPEHDDDCRQRGRLKPRGEALDDVRRVSGDRSLRRLLDRRKAGRSVIFRQSEQQCGDGDADQRAQVKVPPLGGLTTSPTTLKLRPRISQ